MDEKALLEQIVRARESIKRKHLALKVGKASMEQAFKEKIKPITRPLEKMAESWVTLKNSEEIPQQSFISFKPKKNTSTFWNNTFHSAIEDDEDEKIDENHYTTHNSTFRALDAENNKFIASSPTPANKLLRMLKNKKQKQLDTKYGVRICNNVYKIGDTPITFANDRVIVGNSDYTATQGLLELIFMNNPREEVISEKDFQDYGKILQTTNAHKKYYSSSESIRKDKTRKFTNFVARSLDISGSGFAKPKKLPTYMTVSDKPVEYVHWDDPNELVDRLRLLVAERQAGNPSHDNEIISIIEELREAEIIY